VEATHGVNLGVEYPVGPQSLGYPLSLYTVKTDSNTPLLLTVVTKSKPDYFFT
jgi:hypothetical protein